MSHRDVSPRIGAIAERFAGRFPDRPVAWRTVGREAEYPIVQADGSAAEASALWASLREAAADRGVALQPKREGPLVVGLDGHPYSFIAEVGRGTVEVLTGPADDLVSIADDHEAAMEVLLEVAAAHGWSVLGYGIQPTTLPSAAFLSPKVRYGVLHEALGDPWLWFTLTASDQVHAAICRAELVPFTNLANLLAPVTVALCANSPVYAGADSGFCSAREGRMGEIHAGSFRHGMPRGPLSSVTDLVSELAEMSYLMERVRTASGDWECRVYDQPFTRWMEQYGADPQVSGREELFEAFLLHEHYVWRSARPRSAHATLELRAACQQPWVEPGVSERSHHMAAAALGVAMVAAGAELAPWLESALGPDAWARMRSWHHDVVRDGLAAAEPETGLISVVLDHCEAALSRRGRGEEAFLAPLRARLARRENAAQRVRHAFEAGGIPALVAATRIVA